MGSYIGWILLGLVTVVVLVIVYVKRSFFKEGYEELKKVTWPTKDQAINSAVVTIIFIVFFSLILAVMDYAINFLVMALVK